MNRADLTMAESLTDSRHFPWRPLPHSFREVAARQKHAVLLETSRAAPDARSYLFTDPIELLEPRTPEELFELFDRIDAETKRGRWIAGFIPYEAGYVFEPKLTTLLSPYDQPLAWIGIFDSVQIFHHSSEGNWSDTAVNVPAIAAEPPTLSETPLTYTRKVQQVRDWIASGEAYQANLTMQAQWSGTGGTAVYDAAMAAQPVEYGAWLRLGEGEEVISASPELFFRRVGNSMLTRPMKGTATRGRWLEEDTRKAAWLRTDEKNRSENLMIVDLLRNDLGRICELGSVHVERMFAVDTFPTVLQMTSDIRGTLRPEIGSGDIFRALFPSGSIVGAPKIRTMQLLHTLEKRRRGVYTGAIGCQGPQQVGTWSVAIRTIHLRNGECRMGVGSGIVWESNAASEFEECRAKCSFLARKSEPFELIETLLWDGEFARLAAHISRIQKSATFFDIPFDEDAMRGSLRKSVQSLDSRRRWRVRLTMTASGAFKVTSAELLDLPTRNLRLLLVDENTAPEDTFLFHKTTHRKQYDQAFERASKMGFIDALFCNIDGELTECATHNIFVRIGGNLLTPPLTCGLLAGVLREELLQGGLATERRLRRADLQQAQSIVLTNSVRGAREVFEVSVESEKSGETLLWRAGCNV